jgi:hypothetical protein
MVLFREYKAVCVAGASFDFDEKRTAPVLWILNISLENVRGDFLQGWFDVTDGFWSVLGD